MNKISAAILAAAVLVSGAEGACRQPNDPPAERTASSPSEASRALRKTFLELTPEKAGITLSPDQRVWGGAMELSMGDVTITVTSLLDGTASIYISSGGAVIGGGGHESVRKAAQAFVRTLASCASDFRSGPIQDFPAPNRVRFYALSRSGLLHSEEVSGADLEGLKHPLSFCYASARSVITELRLVSERKSQP